MGVLINGVFKSIKDILAGQTVAQSDLDDTAQYKSDATLAMQNTISGKHTVPSADSTANVDVADVIGNKTDAEVVSVGTTKSIMSCVKSVLTRVYDLVAGSELVVNGNMELDSDWINVNAASAVRSDEQAHSGTYSWKITFDAAGTAMGIEQSITGLTIGETYVVTAYIRGLDLAAQFFKISLGADVDTVAVSNGSWVKLSGSRIAISTSEWVQVYIWNTDIANANKMCYVDDVSIREVKDLQGIYDDIITAESNIRGADSDTLKTLSDQVDAIDIDIDIDDVTSGLVGSWPLSKMSYRSGVFVDVGIEGNVGTPANAPSFAYDWLGHANNVTAFVAVNGDYIDCGRDPSLDMGDGDFTICARIKTVSSELGIIIWKGSAGEGGKRYRLYSESDILIAGIDDNTTLKVIYGTTTISDGESHHVALVRDGNYLRLFVDGVEDQTPTDITGYGSLDDTNKDFCIGISSHDETSNPFDGDIDGVRVYNRALTTSELEHLAGFNTGSTIHESLATVESNIRGADDDTLKTLSDQIDGVGGGGGGRGSTKYIQAAVGASIYVTKLEVASGSGKLLVVGPQGGATGVMSVRITLDGVAHIVGAIDENVIFIALNPHGAIDEMFISSANPPTYETVMLNADYKTSLKVEASVSVANGSIKIIYIED